MNRLLSGFLVAILTLFAFTRVAAAGQCKTEIMVDHSGSMGVPRSDGVLKADGTTPTRCYAAGLVVQELVQSIIQGNTYDIHQINDGGIVVSSTDVYDSTCPNLTDRMVSIRVFHVSDTYDSSIPSSILGYDDITGGFVPALNAFTKWTHSKYYDATKREPLDNCVGATPLAQAMCVTAGDFGPGLPATGDLREAMFLTDGGENVSMLPGCRDGEADPLDPGAPGSGGWGDHVVDQLVAHGVRGHGFLFTEGVQSLALHPSAASREQLPIGLGLKALTLGAPAAPATSDQVWLQSMATRTNGTLATVPDTQVTATASMVLDTDGDGVPDFRDFCPFGMCVDTDGDQIPDSMDACIVSEFEDGKGPFPADGCSDFDADGVHDGLDKCPLLQEDWYPPKPNDGCPRPTPAPAPAAPTGIVMLLGFGLLGLGIVRTRRAKRLGS